MNTDFLGLALTAISEDAMTFLDWRTLMNGVGGGGRPLSNMQIIDRAVSKVSYHDVSSEYDPSDDPFEYLCGLGDGKFYLSYGHEDYYADNVTSHYNPYSTIVSYSSDGVINKRVYNLDDNSMILVCDIDLTDSLQFNIPLKVPTPENGTDAVNKDYVDEAPKFVYGDLDVPETHFRTQPAEITDFFPTPVVGNYVIGRNGRIGLVTSINSIYVNVRGTDRGVSEYKDVTADYGESEYSDPWLYLANAGNGRFTLLYTVPGVTQRYEAVNWGVYSEITQYGDDSIICKRVYINGTKSLDYEIGSSSIAFATAVSGVTPTSNNNFTTKAYVDALESRIDALEAAVGIQRI